MSESWPVGLVRERDQARAEVERLRRTNSRLRKGVTWLVGALHDEHKEREAHNMTGDGCEVWECMRARAVLDETKEAIND